MILEVARGKYKKKHETIHKYVNNLNMRFLVLLTSATAPINGEKNAIIKEEIPIVKDHKLALPILLIK
tara:strand:+ start:2494 stop:2697 length:204 start_codon:yes stop_codon:yes gene_type:complete